MNTFISHSSKDKPLVLKIADQLREKGVWLDTWEMDAGDSLSDKIEKGIDEARNFVIILSKNSIESSWVKYELNMAIIKYLSNENYRIITVRIDDVNIPLRLQPFLRIESSNPTEIATKILEADSSTGAGFKILKRQFVNRNDEIDSLTTMLYERETKFINIIGFYGIGKTSLIRETLKRVYTSPSSVEINLSQAHFGSRLTLELCSLAEITAPQDGASIKTLYQTNLLALETLLSQNNFIIFNKVEAVLDDDGEFNDDFKFIISHFSDKEILSDFPLIFLSTRWTDFKFVSAKLSEFIRVKGLTDKHLSFILQSEIERIDKSKILNQPKLTQITKQLHGYPLAGRLLAPLIIKYGEDYLTSNLHVIHQLKIDIAEDIISKISLDDAEIQLLEVLSIFESPLNPAHIKEVLQYSDQDFVSYIDNLVNLNLVESNGDELFLHPLISNFYLKLVRTTDNFVRYAKHLAEIAKRELVKLESTNEKYVYWLTSACRMLFYCGDLVGSRSLRADLIGELKNAAIKLYQRRDYDRSLTYCNDYLETRPDDIDILFYKARCLSRTGHPDEAITILQRLLETEDRPKQQSKYNFALGRAYVENSLGGEEDEYLDKAQFHFQESIRLTNYASALQSMGELLYRRKKNEEAAGFLERKLDETPSDPFALSIYADILWTMGRKPEALDKITNALSFQPKNPNFLFRAGRFLQESGELDKAYQFYTASLANDETYVDARLSLCNTCIDLEKLDEAKQHIDYLKGKLQGEKRWVLDSIIANYYLKINDAEKADELSEKLLKNRRDVVSIGLRAKVLVKKFRDTQKRGLSTLAETDRIQAIDLINEGLNIEPDNEQLKAMFQQLS